MRSIRIAAVLSALFLAVACSSDGDGGKDGSGGAGAAGGSGGDGGSGGSGGGGEGGSGGGGGGEELPTILDVRGTLVDGAGQPLAGLKVALNGDLEGAVDSGADGSFSFDAVDLPYVLTVRTSAALVELRDLRRGDPIIPVVAEFKVARRASVRGQVSGIAFPIGGDEKLLLTVDGDPAMAIEADAMGSFDTELLWYGPKERTGRLHVVHLRSKFGGVVEFLAAGHGPALEIVDRGRLADLEVELEDDVVVETMTTTVSLDRGAYGTSWWENIGYFYLDGARFLFPSAEEIRSEPTEIELPVEGGGFTVRASDAWDNRVILSTRARPDDATELVLPTPVGLEGLEPAHGATGVSVTPTLRWTAVPGAKNYWLSINGMIFVLPGDENSMTLPDYSGWGRGLTEGEGCGWEVYAFLEEGFGPDDVTDGSGMGFERHRLMDEVTIFQTRQLFFLPGT